MGYNVEGFEVEPLKQQLGDSNIHDDDKLFILENIEEYEKNVLKWGRNYRNPLEPVEGYPENVYRKEVGDDFRVFFIRINDVLWAVGFIKKTGSSYDREVGQIVERARRLREQVEDS